MFYVNIIEVLIMESKKNKINFMILKNQYFIKLENIL